MDDRCEDRDNDAGSDPPEIGRTEGDREQDSRGGTPDE
jgi:hypothetical protein